MSDWVERDCGLCSLGTACVRFRLDGHRAILVSFQFQPYQEPPQAN
jgi:hypothetical protein